MTQRRPTKAFYVLYSIGTFCGAAIIYWQIHSLQKQKASYQWPTTTGTVLQATREYMPGRDSHYRANIAYDYKVNETRYMSRRLSLWSPDLSSYNILNKEFVASHPAGTTVTVYYDPTQPSNAVLIPGANENENKLQMGLGGIALIAGICGIIFRFRREPKLVALLNSPDAKLRTIEMRKMDIERGVNAFVANYLVAFVFLMFAVVLLLSPLLRGPAILLEAPSRNSSPSFIWGILCAAGFVVFLIRGMRKARSAECPLCGNLLNKKVYSTCRCNQCGTRIIFDGRKSEVDPATAGETETAASNDVSHPAESPRHETITSGFQKDRLIDVLGLVVFPIIFAWLWVGSEERHDPGIAIILTVVFSMVGGLFYFFPEKAGSRKRHHNKTMEPEDGKHGPYQMDFSVILSAPVGLLVYLLYLTWQHQVLGIAGLIGIVIGFPVAVGIVTYVCKQRFTHAQKLNLPKPPAFVPLTLLALWLVGTFIWMVFAACLIFRWLGKG